MTDDRVLESMERYGGSFVQALAQCYRRADDENRRTLRQAFSTYWVQYAELARQAQALGDAATDVQRRALARLGIRTETLEEDC